MPVVALAGGQGEQWNAGLPRSEHAQFVTKKEGGAIMRDKPSQGRDNNMATLIPALGSCLSRLTAGERRSRKQFNFDGVGIQVQGRTTVLKINCRNTRQNLQTASPREKAFTIIDQLSHAHKEGHAWGDMAIEYNLAVDAIQILAMKVSKGRVFPAVALPEVEPMPVGSTQARRATA